MLGFLLILGLPAAIQQTPAQANEPAPKATSAPFKKWDRSIEVGEIKDGRIRFRRKENDADATPLPPPLQTRLTSVKAFGLLFPPDDAGVPYVLLSGRPCREAGSCHEPRNIYLIRADGTDHHQFTHPGQIKDRRRGRIYHRSKAYFGRCLPGRGDVFVSFQEDKVDGRRYRQHSVLVAEVGSDGIEEKLLVRRRPRLRTTQRRVKRDLCARIPDEKRSMKREPLHRLKYGRPRRWRPSRDRASK